VDMHAFPWMVRIIDVKKALSNIKVNYDGSAVVKVLDNFCSWNNKKLILQNKDSKLEVKETEKSEDLEISISALSALLYGSDSFEEINKKNSINYRNEKKRNLIKKWFPKKMVFNPCFF